MNDVENNKFEVKIRDSKKSKHKSSKKEEVQLNEKEKEYIEEQIEVRETNRLNYYLDLSTSKNLSRFVIVFLLAFLVVVFIYIAVFWPDGSNDDSHRLLNGDIVGDESSFMEDNIVKESHWDYELTLPDELIVFKNESICNNFFDYACGGYDGNQNMLTRNLQMRNFYELKRIIAENNEYEFNPTLSQFNSLCVRSILSKDDNVKEILQLLSKLASISASSSPMAYAALHMGISAIAIYNYEDQVISWTPSPWLKYNEKMIIKGCTFLSAYHFFNDTKLCVNAMKSIYLDISSILSNDANSVRFTAAQFNEHYPALFETYFYPSSALDHVFWSHDQLAHLYLLVHHDFFKEWIMLLAVLDSYTYVPSVGTPTPLKNTLSAEDIRYSGVYYRNLQKNIGAPENNHHIFRHGFGMDSLALVHSVSLDKARAEAENSCNWLTTEMFPHEIQQARESNDYREKTERIFKEVQDFVNQQIKNSPFIHDDRSENSVKNWVLKYSSSIRLQLGFPGEPLIFKEKYSSLLEMIWDIRILNMQNNFHLIWPPSFHSSTCNAKAILNEQIILLPYCLYSAQWLNYNLYFVILHEYMHFLYPPVMKKFGANPHEMDNLFSRLSCYDIEPSNKERLELLYAERWADIQAGSILYKLCIAQKKCIKFEDFRDFIVSLSQWFCDKRNAFSNMDVHGSDKSRLNYILQNMMNNENINPFHDRNRWTCASSQNRCTFF